MTTPAATNRSLSLKFLFLLFSYFSLHILLRVLVSDSLDYDEAEQALLSQWLLPGYTEQPPLYTWVQYYLIQLFGKKIFAISLLKNLLLFLTYLSVYLSAERLLKDTRTAILATSSLLLIPQIAWESQRDMTHTTLVVFAAASVLWLTLRLIENRTFLNYWLLGMFCGIGFLAKANFTLFFAVISLTLITFPEGRKIIFSKMVFITLLFTIAMNAYYFSWMYSNQEIVFSATHKFKQVVETYSLQGIKSFFTSTFMFLTPLWFFYLLFFPAGFWRDKEQRSAFSSRFMSRYGLVSVSILIIVVIVFKITYVKDRWLQPLLFAAPLIFFSGLEVKAISQKQFKRFLIVAVLAAMGVYIAFTLRVVSAPLSHTYSRLSYPFTALAIDIRKSGFSSGLIISNKRFLAGNMLFQFPDSDAVIPGYNFEKLPYSSSHTMAAVMWKADISPDIPPQLTTFLKNTYDINSADYAVNYYDQPFKGSSQDSVKLAVLKFPLLQGKTAQ